jgi:hypothetical protein
MSEQNKLVLVAHKEEITAQKQEIDSLKASMDTLIKIINQPIPTCSQTARQRIVELSQVTGKVLFLKGQKPTIPEAMREVWSRLLLKLKHSSARKDIALLRSNLLKKYDTDMELWKKQGGIKPKKKDYDWNYAKWIEHLSIEQEALACLNAVAAELL